MTAALKALEQAKAAAIRIPAELYHQRPELSNSQNNILIDETPAHFQEYKKNPPKQTKAMMEGQIIHSAILEPEPFLDTHVAVPECDRRTKAGKDFYEKFCIEHADKVKMDNDLYHRVFGMIGSVMAHRKARETLVKNHNELSFFGQLDGVAVRCRPDILRAGNLIADLKTTESAKEGSFQYDFTKYKYYRQCAFYLDLVTQVTGQKHDMFSIIAVEKHPPYAVQVFGVDDATIEKGREEYRRGLEIYRQCLESDKWPAYSDEVVPLNLCSWAW